MTMGGRTVWDGKSSFREKLKRDEEQEGRTRNRMEWEAKFSRG